MLIKPDEGTGSTVPAGDYTAKQGYDFDVSFSENPAWCFIKWIAVAKDNPQNVITDGVVFEAVTSPSTKVKITTDTPIKLIPYCEERIAVYGTPSPSYNPLGSPFDTPISVNFTKTISEESFIFSEKEIPSDVKSEDIKRDENGNIWAYSLNGQTHLKNISITNADDYSIAEHFKRPQVSSKLLLIEVDGTNPIEFNSGELIKTVKVSLSKDITDSLGIKMNNAVSWNYQIIEETNKKASVNLTCTAAEGSVYLAGTKSFSLGSKITLAFTESADYQFVKWDYDSEIIYVEDSCNISTTAIVLKSTDSKDTQIKAVCAPRLRATFAPINDSSKPTVSKNSSIVITFDHDLPTDEAGLKQLENITIAVGGSPVKSSFKAPVINAGTVTFTADSSNMLNVPAGQTKTVSVSIPADFYYQLEDGTKVTYGGSGITFDYKIDETTLQKAEITFTVSSGSGTISPAAGNYYNYSIGQEVPIVFNMGENYQFTGWKITSEGQPIDESKIKIVDKNALSTKLIVYEAIPGVTVLADSSEKLKITSVTPSSDINNKDSSIMIVFNKNLFFSSTEERNTLLNSIRVNMDGTSVDSNFSKEVSGKIITFTNTKYLSVPDGLQKTVTVSVPSSFYYKDGTNEIKLGQDYSFSYVVNSSSKAQTTLNYQMNAGSGTLAPAIGQTDYSYSLDKEIPISFEPTEGYEFTGWTVTYQNGNEVETSKIKIDDPSKKSTKLYIYEKVDNVIVKANSYLIPTITANLSYSEGGVSCDSAVVLSFNKQVKNTEFVTFASDGIIQIVNPSNEYEHYESYFNTPVWSTDKKVVTISPKHTIRNLLANSSDHKNLRVLINYKLIEDTEGHTLQKDPTFVYRINYSMESMNPTVTMSLYKPAGYNLNQDSNGEYHAVENGSYSVLSNDVFDKENKKFPSNETYTQNHVGAKIYFDANVVDEGSGYRKLTITETLINTVGGDPVTGAIAYETTITNEDDNFDDSVSINSVHPYSFKSTMDGVVQLIFEFVDWADNPTKNIWYVIKDTTVADNLLIKDNPLSANKLLKSYYAVPEKNYTDTGYRTVYYYVDGELTEDNVHLRKSDSSGNYTEVIKFSNPDIFYKDKSLMSEYKIEWGYSESNLCNIAVKESDGVFSFTRNVDNICYVRIICCDAAGNINSTLVKYPKKNIVFGLKAANSVNGITWYNPLYTNTADGVILFYKYTNPATGEVSKILYPHNSHTSDSTLTGEYFMFEDYWFTDETKTPDGIYSIYVIPYYKYGAAYYYGVVSEPYIVYHNVDIPEGVFQEPVFPDDFNYSIDDPNPNSTGIRNICVTLPEDFVPTSNCTYGVTVGGLSSKMLDYNFSVNSLSSYNLFLAAIDAKGDFHTSTKYKHVDATYDNVPPECSINMTYSVRALSSPNEVLLFQEMLPFEKYSGGNYQSGIKETVINGSTKRIFNYYYKKYDSNISNIDLHENANNKVLLNISRNELNQLEKKTATYNSSDKQVKLDFKQTIEGYYFLILELEDKNGNYSIKPGLVSNMVIPKFTNITVSGTSTNNYSIKSTESFLPDWSYTLFFGNCYLKDNDWIAVKRVGNGLSRVDEFSFSENHSFIKTSINGLRNSLYTFFNPEYYIKQNAGETPVCNSKSVIQGLAGSYQVFYDAPCFAHTMAFPTDKVSDLKAKTDEAFGLDETLDRTRDYNKVYAAVWETKGQEYGLKLINSSWLTSASTSTYTAPVSEIPSGYSYVTVFHFADGTSVMSDVKQK